MFQCVEPRSPDLAVLLYPRRNFIQPLEPCLAVSLTSLLFDHYQSTLREYFDMLIYRGAANRKVFRHRIDIKRLRRDHVNYLPPRWISNCLEYISAHIN